MKCTLNCLPCLIRQALDACRMSTQDPKQQETIMRTVFTELATIDMNLSPPAFARRIHRVLREQTGCQDPYLAAKQQHNSTALAIAPEAKKHILTAVDPLRKAIAIAIAGNVIDLGTQTTISEHQIMTAIDQAISTPILGQLDECLIELRHAKSILYLLDNAGEIVFDGLLMEQLGPDRITAVVRGAPILNDVTRNDLCGLPEGLTLIDNGSDAPGTLLDETSPDFHEHFMHADVIIAKGQGNFETLSDSPRSVFFLFKVKCPVVAELTHHPLGAHLLLKQPKGLS